MYKCKFCGREFESLASMTVHTSHCKNNPNKRTKEYYSEIAQKSRITYIEHHQEKYVIKEFECICPRCGKTFIVKTTQQKFDKGDYPKYCSKSCANTRHHSIETKQKISQSIQKNINKIKQEDITKQRQYFHNKEHVCKNCGKTFYRADAHSLNYCSIECRKEWIKNNVKSGGYRQGSGRGKQGWYKNIYCDSSWELAFVIYHLDNNLPIERCKETFEYIYEGQKHTYHPDFITLEMCQKESKYVISKKLNVSWTTINRWCKYYGI